MVKESVKDGPIDPALYAQISPKILHLLKQPTTYNPSLPALFRELVEDSRWSMLMRRTAERSYCILNHFASWEEVSAAGDIALGNALRCSAVVNLANDDFKAGTSPEKVYEWARTRKARWHGQIKAYSPDIIICGGTFSAVWQALGRPDDWAETTTGMQYFQDPEVKGCTYIEMPHPSVRWPKAMVYTFLAASVPEILAGRKFPRI